MKMDMSVNIFFFTILLTSYGQSDQDVFFAAILYRHGERTPTHPYPTDPYRNESFWPVQFGQLTNEGKLQHYRLGQWLRQRYSHLLSPDFKNDDIYVLSTDMDRTLMSAQANLAGLYPPTNRSLWNKDVFWQPIPVHTIPEEIDHLLGMRNPCPAYDAEKARIIETDDYKKLLRKYKSLFNYVSEHAGKTVDNLVELESIYNTLYIEKLYNLTLPKWAESVYNEMQKPACYSYALHAYNSKMARLTIGPLIKEIARHMEKAARAHNSTEVSTESAYKVTVYSAHDRTVANLLNALGLFDGSCPMFAATVLLELIDFEGVVSVRISVRNTPDIVEPVVLNITSCGPTCPLHKFISLYQHLMPNDWDKECQASSCEWCWLSYAVLGALIVCWTFCLIKTMKM